MRAFSLVASFAVFALVGANGMAGTRTIGTVSHGKLYPVCHRAGPHNFITLRVVETALAYHVGHGDHPIECPKDGGGETPS